MTEQTCNFAVSNTLVFHLDDNSTQPISFKLSAQEINKLLSHVLNFYESTAIVRQLEPNVKVSEEDAHMVHSTNAVVETEELQFGNQDLDVAQIDKRLLKVAKGNYSDGEKEGLTFKSEQAMHLINTYGDFVFKDLDHLQTSLVDKLNDTDANLYRIAF